MHFVLYAFIKYLCQSIIKVVDDKRIWRVANPRWVDHLGFFHCEFVSPQKLPDPLWSWFPLLETDFHVVPYNVLFNKFLKPGEHLSPSFQAFRVRVNLWHKTFVLQIHRSYFIILFITLLLRTECISRYKMERPGRDRKAWLFFKKGNLQF